MGVSEFRMAPRRSGNGGLDFRMVMSRSVRVIGGVGDLLWFSECSIMALGCGCCPFCRWK